MILALLLAIVVPQRTADILLCDNWRCCFIGRATPKTEWHPCTEREMAVVMRQPVYRPSKNNLVFPASILIATVPTGRTVPHKESCDAMLAKAGEIAIREWLTDDADFAVRYLVQLEALKKVCK